MAYSKFPWGTAGDTEGPGVTAQPWARSGVRCSAAQPGELFEAPNSGAHFFLPSPWDTGGGSSELRQGRMTSFPPHWNIHVASGAPGSCSRKTELAQCNQNWHNVNLGFFFLVFLSISLPQQDTGSVCCLSFPCLLFRSCYEFGSFYRSFPSVPI